MKRRSAIFLVAIGLLTSAAAHSESAQRFSGEAWALLNEPSTMVAATAITPTAYPNCDEATVDERIEYAYEVDGTGESQDESFTKVLTEKGKRDARTMGYPLRSGAHYILWFWARRLFPAHEA
jgi:hypothetical protein